MGGRISDRYSSTLASPTDSTHHPRSHASHRRSDSPLRCGRSDRDRDRGVGLSSGVPRPPVVDARFGAQASAGVGRACTGVLVDRACRPLLGVTTWGDRRSPHRISNEGPPAVPGSFGRTASCSRRLAHASASVRGDPRRVTRAVAMDRRSPQPSPRDRRGSEQGGTSGARDSVGLSSQHVARGRVAAPDRDDFDAAALDATAGWAMRTLRPRAACHPGHLSGVRRSLLGGTTRDTHSSKEMTGPDTHPSRVRSRLAGVSFTSVSWLSVWCLPPMALSARPSTTHFRGSAWSCRASRDGRRTAAGSGE